VVGDGQEAGVADDPRLDLWPGGVDTDSGRQVCGRDKRAGDRSQGEEGQEGQRRTKTIIKWFVFARSWFAFARRAGTCMRASAGS